MYVSVCPLHLYYYIKWCNWILLLFYMTYGCLNISVCPNLLWKGSAWQIVRPREIEKEREKDKILHCTSVPYYVQWLGDLNLLHTLGPFYMDYRLLHVTFTLIVIHSANWLAIVYAVCIEVNFPSMKPILLWSISCVLSCCANVSLFLYIYIHSNHWSEHLFP